MPKKQLKLPFISETKSNMGLSTIIPLFGQFMQNSNENVLFLLEYPDKWGQFAKNDGSFLPGVVRIDEPDTFCGRYPPPTPSCAMHPAAPEKCREADTWSKFEQLGMSYVRDAPAAVVSD